MAVSHDWQKLFFEVLGLEAAKEAKSNGWVESKCPLHDDEKPSFAFNIQNGGFNCQGCGEKGGGVDLFGRLRVHGYIPGDREKWREANNAVHEALGTKPYKAEHRRKAKGNLPKPQEILDQHDALLAPENSKALDYLLNERHWGIDVIEDLKIGYDPEKGRYWFTITRDGIVVNIRKYKPGGSPKMKGIWNRNSAAVWPEKALKESEGWIWIMEGEPDTVAARTCAINAVALCTGAQTLPKSEIPRFQGKSVVVCFDADDAGRQGAQRMAVALARHTLRVKVLDLSAAALEIHDKKKWSGDFTDWVCDGFNVEELIRYSDELETFKFSKSPEEDSTVYRPNLGDSVSGQYSGRKVEFPALTVIAMAEAPYMVHTDARIICHEAGSIKACAICPLGSGSQQYKADVLSNDILQQVDVSDITKKKVIKHKISALCERFEIDPSSEMIALYELLVSESVDSWSVDDADSAVTQFVVYSVGNRFHLNQSYRFKGTATNSPKKQTAALVFTESEPVEDELDTFQIKPDSDLANHLIELFQVKPRPEISADMESAMDDLIGQGNGQKE